MRAGVLSNNRIIEYLNKNFINTWVPNCELGRVPSLRDPIAKRRESEGKTFDTTHALAQAIMKGWKQYSPVDCLIISPEFEVMGRQLGNELHRAGGDTARHYLTFLQESLAGKLPGLGEDTSEPEPLNSDTVLSNLNVVLNDVRTSQEVLNIFRTPEPGYQDYTVVEIDATAFENGGLLTIDITLGHAEASGSFDLFDGDSELPTEGAPENALVSKYGIRPDESGTIKYHFDRGQVFKLGATGDWFSKKGSVNAFWAKISVEPDRKPEPKKVSPLHSMQSAEDVMNAFVKAFKNLDTETIRSMLTGNTRETFEIHDGENLTEDMRTQFSQMMSSMKILSSGYADDEFHFQLRMPIADPPELTFKMQKVDGIWLIYDAK